jgi:sensor histidine kinase regulating citrate/malate metabolism
VLGILLDNVYTHVLEDGECGEVNVQVKPLIHDMISISVEDNGCGFLKNGEGTTIITLSSWDIESKGVGLYLASRFVA